MNYPENAVHDLTILYLQTQNLENKSVDELADAYKTTYEQINECLNQPTDSDFGVQI